MVNIKKKMTGKKIALLALLVASSACHVLQANVSFWERKKTEFRLFFALRSVYGWKEPGCVPASVVDVLKVIFKAQNGLENKTKKFIQLEERIEKAKQNGRDAIARRPMMIRGFLATGVIDFIILGLMLRGCAQVNKIQEKQAKMLCIFGCVSLIFSLYKYLLTENILQKGIANLDALKQHLQEHKTDYIGEQ